MITYMGTGGVLIVCSQTVPRPTPRYIHQLSNTVQTVTHILNEYSPELCHVRCITALDAIMAQNWLVQKQVDFGA